MVLRGDRTFESFFKVKLANKKEGTRVGYQYGIKEFERFCAKLDPPRNLEEIIVEMKHAEPEEVIDTIQDWINTSNTKGNNMRCRVTQVHKYLRYRGVKLDSMDMKDLEYKIELTEERRALQLDEIQKIIEQARPKRKALYITLASTGMTVGEACQIRKGDMDFTQSRIVIDIKAKYTKKDSRPRKVYLSREAERHLKRFLDKIGPNDLVFGESENPALSIAAEQMSLRRIVDNLGINTKYESGLRHITLHAFRAYFFTKAMQKHDIAYAHRLCGHQGHLEMYARWSDEKKLKMFIELEPELYIFMKKPDSEEMYSLKEHIKKQDKEARLILYELNEVAQKTLPRLRKEKDDPVAQKIIKALEKQQKEIDALKQANLSS